MGLVRRRPAGHGEERREAGRRETHRVADKIVPWAMTVIVVVQVKKRSARSTIILKRREAELKLN